MKNTAYNTNRVLVGMSGGVDSSVVSYRLRELGYEVTGVFFCLGNAVSDKSLRSCCSPQDAGDAHRVCDALGIELYVLNGEEKFGPIIEGFVEEYARGRTPNPCVVCNARLKFEWLEQLADQLSVYHIATGHYARILQKSEGEWVIGRPEAREKDQSYVLFGISKTLLPRILFPLGDVSQKAETRALARRYGLHLSEKPESQEICFVGDAHYAELLQLRAPHALESGPIVSMSGQVLGTHKGYGRFTVGQRRGLGISAPEPLYVVSVDASRRTVTVGAKEETLCKRLTATHANWHVVSPVRPFEAEVQIRYRHKAAHAMVDMVDEQTFEVEFLEPVYGVTPGQAAVVYEDGCVLGGGWIK